MKLTVSSIQKTVNKLCDPSKLYLLLSFAGTVLYLINFMEHKPMYTLPGLGGQIVVMVVWTYILNWVCSMKNGVTISWILVFMPFILMGLILVMVFKTIEKGDIQQLLLEDQDNELEGFCDSCN